MTERKLPEGVYAEKPNQVQIVFKDESGEAERWVTGKTLNEVLEQFGMSLHVDGPTKTHRKRRTKAEIAAAAPSDGIERKDTVTAGADKAWP